MSAAQRHPIRVLVKGSSLVTMTPERHPARGAYTFPRWAQNKLTDLGWTCELDNRGVAGERTRSAFRRWEAEVMARCPDAVIFGYAYYECIHAFLPHGLERHVNGYTWRRGPIRGLYRRWILRPLWKAGAQLQRVLDGAIRDRLFAATIRRVTRDYTLLIERTRRLTPGRPTVFVLELLGPGGQAGGWFPGMQDRIDAMNRALTAMVAGLDDPGVRLVPVAQLAATLDPPEDPVPDGLHYSPRMRRLLGEWIGAEVDRALKAADSGPVAEAGR